MIIEIKPLPRGSGFQFEEKIHGGSVPKQWIPAVEEGVREAMRKGPLGFEVVDVAVALDRRQLPQRRQLASSRSASRAGSRCRKRLPRRSPHLLEPMHKLERRLPVERDQPDHLGGRRAARPDARHGAARRLDRLGPDRALIPEAELAGLEAELRSQSQGLATYEAEFDHLAELNGPLADKVIQQRVPEPA